MVILLVERREALLRDVGNLLGIAARLEGSVSSRSSGDEVAPFISLYTTPLYRSGASGLSIS